MIEVMGGMQPALTYMLSALNAGKSVVTANKDVVASEGKKLLDTAKANGRDFLYEASVAGGIPIIRPLKQCLAGNHITDVIGIFNGTTNFILTKMSKEGMELTRLFSWRRVLAMRKRILLPTLKGWMPEEKWRFWRPQRLIPV